MILIGKRKNLRKRKPLSKRDELWKGISQRKWERAREQESIKSDALWKKKEY